MAVQRLLPSCVVLMGVAVPLRAVLQQLLLPVPVVRCYVLMGDVLPLALLVSVHGVVPLLLPTGVQTACVAATRLCCLSRHSLLTLLQCVLLL